MSVNHKLYPGHPFEFHQRHRAKFDFTFKLKKVKRNSNYTYSQKLGQVLRNNSYFWARAYAVCISITLGRLF